MPTDERVGLLTLLDRAARRAHEQGQHAGAWISWENCPNQACHDLRFIRDALLDGIGAKWRAQFEDMGYDECETCRRARVLEAWSSELSRPRDVSVLKRAGHAD